MSISGKRLTLALRIAALAVVSLVGCSGSTSGVSNSAHLLPQSGASAVAGPEPLTQTFVSSLSHASLALSSDLHAIPPSTSLASNLEFRGAHPLSSVVASSDEQVGGTLISNGTPYTAMYAQHSAYVASGFPLSRPAGSGAQYLLAPISSPPGGSCLSAGTGAINYGSGAATFFVVFDNCSGAALNTNFVVAQPIDSTFVSKYVTQNAHGLPVYAVELGTPDAHPSSTSTWYVLLRDNLTAHWEIAYQKVGLSAMTVGYAAYDSHYLPGTCPGGLPTVAADNISLWNPSAQGPSFSGPKFDPATSAGSGTATSTLAPGILGGAGCFTADSTRPPSDAFAMLASNNYWAVTTPAITCDQIGSIKGYYPCDLRSAYNLPSTTKGIGQTVAIVDAYDHPNAEADLAVYRSTFGLAPCTTANGCFKKVNQIGGTAIYPAPSTSWAQEISLDLDAVSAACPNCHIVLVEATTNGSLDLAAAVDQSVAMNVNEISNSYGFSEGSSETSLDVHYNHPGIAITASTGDNNYANGTLYPAVSPYVTAVGGTRLVRATSSRGWSESVWNNDAKNGTGSGCSTYEPKPTWQADSGCLNRMTADVSAVADPATGLAEYDSYNATGWIVVGGTSLSSPIIAGVYALAGNAANIRDGSYPYLHPGSLYDVTVGNNGTCAIAYFCTAEIGYDGPTGLGTPNGLGSFGGSALSLAAADVLAPSAARLLATQPSTAASDRVCPPPLPGHAVCMSLRRTDVGRVGPGLHPIGSQVHPQ